MRSAVLYGPHDWRIEDLNIPSLNNDDVLLKVKVCGVCHSEIHQWNVKVNGLEYPRYIGHEVAGEVLESGKDVKSFKPGDRVAVWTDGKGYAEQINVKSNRLFKISDNVSFTEAMAEPIACTTNGVIRANIHLNDSVALVGTGFMGLILLQQLKLRGAKFIAAIDVREEILELAKNLGADFVINPQKENTKDVIKDLTNGKGVDISFEVGGNETTLNLAADICRMEGKLVIFGFHPGPRKIKDLGYWNWMAFDIINAHFRDLNTILNGTRIGMEMLNAGKINMKPLITHNFKLDEIENAFMAAKEKPKGFIKSVIVMN
ncbi:MAG: zinc-binding dehydrogenase [Ignavibacteria bacterium]|nr:zinc-binding dehydrogenase [Ignavibacteria bacterium]